MDASTPPADLLVMIPVLDDWESLELLLPGVDRELEPLKLTVDVLVVDDASATPAPPQLGHTMPGVRSIRVLELKRNLGHQRAIACGFAHAIGHLPFRAALVLDGDGEDRPADIPLLYRRFERSPDRVVFAGRARRTESALFRLLYQVFKIVHLLLTGYRVRVGNFSVLPRSAVERLCVMSETWNHYAAAVFRSRLTYDVVPTHRGRRLRGKSKMNVVSLVVHGLSAISVYSDIVSVRMLVVLLLGIGLAAAVVLAALVFRAATGMELAGWTTYSLGLLVSLALQAALLGLVFVFMTLANRQAATVIPVRDCPYFVRRCRVIERSTS